MRGDADGDGAIKLNDAIVLLKHLFLGGSLSCKKSGDFNDDGSLSLADAVQVIRFVVGLGPPPAEPYPKRGEDLTPDDLSCGG